MRILELTNYTAGGCGVWHRVKQEAQALAEQGHDVLVCSSNRIKGLPGLADSVDHLGKVEIRRFPAWKLGGESYVTFNTWYIGTNPVLKQILSYKPDVIIVHGYRHTLTHIALLAKEKLACKVYLVTHAPFGRDRTRGVVARFYVNQIYDRFIGPRKLKQFTKILTIAQWEEPHLARLGVTKEQIVYLPNGIHPDCLVGTKPGTGKEALLYMGRIAPIKQLETVIQALALLEERLPVTFVGPAEQSYLNYLRALVQEKNIERWVTFIDTRYTLREEIAWLDKNMYFVLPSKSEGMPQVLLEALARGRVVLASDIQGNAELITHGKNGLLYTTGDALALAGLLTSLYTMSAYKKEQLGKEGIHTAKQFLWPVLLERLERVIRA